MVKKKEVKKSSIKSKSKVSSNKKTSKNKSSKSKNSKKGITGKKAKTTASKKAKTDVKSKSKSKSKSRSKVKKIPLKKIQLPKDTVKWIVGIAIILVIVILIGKSISPMGQKAKHGDIVKVMYTGKLDTGEVFDTNIKEVADANGITKPGYDPLRFTLGNKQVIPGFEAGILGMRVGENKIIEIDAKDAYGEYRADLVKTIPREQFEQSFTDLPEIFEGMELVYSTPQGEQGVMYIKSISQQLITLDFNHKLAGKKLIFEVQLVSIAE